MIPDAALGATIAAIIAAALSLLGLIVSKEQKISELRQAWIDQMRDDVAILIAALYAIQVSEKTASEASFDVWQKARLITSPQIQH